MQLLMKFTGTTGHSARLSQSLAQQISLFALMVGLWGLNLFPVQRAELVLTASAVVSPQRLASLQMLSKQSDLANKSIRWVHYQRDTRRPSGESQVTGLEHIILRLGVCSGVSAEQIQTELERLTLPTVELESTHKDQSELRAQRWRLATIKHQMALFELDRSREKHAIQEVGSSDQDQALGSTEASTKATVVVHRKLNAQLQQEPLEKTPDPAIHRKTWQWLASDYDRSVKRIEQIESQIQQTTARASGTLAMTGSPRLGVLSSPASIAHCLSVAAFCGLACLGLVMVLRIPRFASGKYLRASRPKNTTISLDTMGLRNFGTILIQGESATNIPLVQEPLVPTSKSIADRQILQTRRLVDALLMVWVVCFSIRFLIDGNWRELLFTAPLSAFSSIVFGV